MFLGQKVQKMTCKRCGRTKCIFSNFWDLPLYPKRPTEGGIELMDMFEDFVKSNSQQSDCDHCPYPKQEFNSTHWISKLPEVLIVGLKRFESNGQISRKSEYEVRFPLNIDLSDCALKFGSIQQFSVNKS